MFIFGMELIFFDCGGGGGLGVKEFKNFFFPRLEFQWKS